MKSWRVNRAQPIRIFEFPRMDGLRWRVSIVGGLGIIYFSFFSPFLWSPIVTMSGSQERPRKQLAVEFIDDEGSSDLSMRFGWDLEIAPLMIPSIYVHTDMRNNHTVYVSKKPSGKIKTVFLVPKELGTDIPAQTEDTALLKEFWFNPSPLSSSSDIKVIISHHAPTTQTQRKTKQGACQSKRLGAWQSNTPSSGRASFLSCGWPSTPPWVSPFEKQRKRPIYHFLGRGHDDWYAKKGQEQPANRSDDGTENPFGVIGRGRKVGKMRENFLLPWLQHCGA